MAAMRTKPSAIALLLGIDVKTLKRACKIELETAHAEAVAAVLMALHRAATGLDGSGRTNTRAAKAWLEARQIYPDEARALEAKPAPGKKVRQRATAEEIARSSRFAPGSAPRLAAVDGQIVKPRSEDEPGK